MTYENLKNVDTEGLAEWEKSYLSMYLKRLDRMPTPGLIQELSDEAKSKHPGLWRRNQIVKCLQQRTET